MPKRPFYASPPRPQKRAKTESTLIPGRVSIHRDGFGFVIPDTPIPGVEGDLFLPPDAAAKAMHGDRVAARITRFGRDGRAEGDIVRILERTHTTVVGKFRVKKRGNYVQPHDDRIQQWIEIPSLDSLQSLPNRVGDVPQRKFESAEDLDGYIVEAQLIQFPGEGQDGVGRIVDVLGRPDDFGVDVEIIIRKHRIPHRFPPDVLEQARAVNREIGPFELAGREDFRSYGIVTIDGETARDFDDAVWVDRLPSGNFALHVHIADVSHHVRPGSPIDREAALRGTSVYFPDRAVPMLPIELSTDICSLRPQEDRLVMSALLELDHQGDIVSQRFTRGVIRSVERMTYTHVHALLEGDEALRERYRPLIGRFELMQELAGILNKKRYRRGSIDFDLPEPLIEFDEFGEMVGVKRAPRNIAHRLIEEFMLAANEAVATHVEATGFPFVYRIHEVPDPKRVSEFEQIALHFGASLGARDLGSQKFRPKGGRDVVIPDANFKIHSRQYQKLIAKLEGRPEERILNYLMLRSLKQARYSEENVGHFALASECYTHFTSPIRRYPDLLVHRILGALLDKREEPYGTDALRDLTHRCSLTERTAAEAERELVEWKKVKFMIDHVGDEFEALIISTTKYGFFVELAELFIEGLVPIHSIVDDRYTYNEGTRRIIGARGKKQYSIGDPVRVRLDRVNAAARQLEFSLVVPTRPSHHKKKKKR
jgi:ribonuclease R